jgi:hypothetical protein
VSACSPQAQRANIQIQKTGQKFFFEGIYTLLIWGVGFSSYAADLRG